MAKHVQISHLMLTPSSNFDASFRLVNYAFELLHFTTNQPSNDQNETQHVQLDPSNSGSGNFQGEKQTLCVRHLCGGFPYTQLVSREGYVSPNSTASPCCFPREWYPNTAYVDLLICIAWKLFEGYKNIFTKLVKIVER